MRLYIVRHADPDYENDRITPEGEKEAKALSERFAQTGLDRIYSSPMGRAIATMRYTAEKLNLGYEIEEWTHEIEQFSIDGSPWGNITAWDVPGELLIGHPGQKPTNAFDWAERVGREKYENYFAMMRTNSDAFLKKLGYERCGTYYRILQPSEEKVAVFCHGGFGLTWLSHLLSLPPESMWADFWLPPSSVTTILFESRFQGRATPRCLGLGDVSHLYKAGLRVLPRGIKANYY